MSPDFLHCEDTACPIFDVRGLLPLHLHSAPTIDDKGNRTDAQEYGYEVKTPFLRLRFFECNWLCDKIVRRLEPVQGSIWAYVSAGTEAQRRTQAQNFITTMSDVLASVHQLMRLQDPDKEKAVKTAKLFNCKVRNHQDAFFVLWVSEMHDVPEGAAEKKQKMDAADATWPYQRSDSNSGHW